MLSDPIRRFRFIAFWEGVSYLVLLGIAMPLKYAAGMPLAVRIVGSLHGGLFVLYVVALFLAAGYGKWSGKRVAQGFIASLLPFGPFWFERKLDQEPAKSVAVEEAFLRR